MAKRGLGEHWTKVWQAGASRVVHRSHTPGVRAARARGERGRRSRLAVHEYNRRLARWNLTLLLNANFIPGDGHLVLHYRRGAGPSSGEEAARHWAALCKALRRGALRAGVQLRYVHAVGIGSTGAVHHHLIVNREAIGLVMQLWGHGSADCRAMYDKRGIMGEDVRLRTFEGLAFYFCGQERGENPASPGRVLVIHGRGYSASRNLVRPQPEVERGEGGDWEAYPEPDEGYVVDPDSLDAGENPVTGQPYLRYVMLPLAAPRGLGEEARARWLRQKAAVNRAIVRDVLDERYLEMERRRRKGLEGER